MTRVDTPHPPTSARRPLSDNLAIAKVEFDNMQGLDIVVALARAYFVNSEVEVLVLSHSTWVFEPSFDRASYRGFKTLTAEKRKQW